jgi:hypothetical protein
MSKTKRGSYRNLQDHGYISLLSQNSMINNILPQDHNQIAMELNKFYSKHMNTRRDKGIFGLWLYIATSQDSS